MGQQRHEVTRRRRIDPLVPELGEGRQAFHQDGELLVIVLHRHVGAGLHGGDVRPIGQLPPLVEGEVEQGGQHLGGQFDRHPIDPVESLAARQFVEDLPGPLTNDRLQSLKVHRRYGRRDRLALRSVLGRIHGNEHRQTVLGEVADADPAQVPFGREHLGIGLDRHDVVVLGD